jgi:pilus assembly protein CpaF
VVDRADIYGRTLKHFLGPVAELLYNDESVSEVLVNGPNTVYCERRGRLEPVDVRFRDAEALEAAARNLAEYVRRELDDDHHSMDARLPEPERFRVHVIIPPCARNGVCLSIRKFKKSTATLEWLVEMNSASQAVIEFLRTAVRIHTNILVAGGTGTGKTSLLNAMSTAIPEEERIIVIEDTAELQLFQPHTIYLEARPPKPDGKGAVTIRDLFVDSLRMRPDRIVVGEVRRGEALDLVQSMLSGHDGSLATIHASTPQSALVRLETLCLMSDVALPVYVARQQAGSAVHLVVQIARVEGARRISEIAKVEGLDDKDRYIIAPLFKYRAGAGWEYSGATWKYANEAFEKGLVAKEAVSVFEKMREK